MIIFRLIILIHIDQVEFSPEKMASSLGTAREMLGNIFQKVVNTIAGDSAVKLSPV